MPQPLASKKRAQAISSALFLIGIAALLFTNSWWPGIMLVIGGPLALRQFLQGRTYDMAISLVVFGGAFITIQFDISWKILLPVLLSIGALYILLKEFLAPEQTSEEEQETDLNQEIEETKKK